MFYFTIVINNTDGNEIHRIENSSIPCRYKNELSCRARYLGGSISEDKHTISFQSQEAYDEFLLYYSSLNQNSFIVTTRESMHTIACFRKTSNVEYFWDRIFYLALSLQGQVLINSTIINFDNPENAKIFITELVKYI